MKFFTQRNKPKPEKYRYDFPDHIRVRIFTTLKAILERQHHLEQTLAELQALILRKFGTLRGTRYYGGQVIGNAALDHIQSCSDEQFLDVLEMLCHVHGFGGRQEGVDSINEIFDEENIGYHMTKWVIVQDQAGIGQYGGFYAPPPSHIEYPQIVLKSEQLLQKEIVEPALRLLADPRFATGNREFVDGLVHLRKGEFDDAITSCGAAFESVLKTICTIKKWKYDAQRDGFAKLVEICQANNLFPSFYRQILEGTGTIRNKVGDAHGKGPRPEYAATKELANHMVHTCCTNILFLVAQAKL